MFDLIIAKKFIYIFSIITQVIIEILALSPRMASYSALYNNKINARVLIGQPAMVYCAGKPMEKSRVFWIIV